MGLILIISVQKTAIPAQIWHVAEHAPDVWRLIPDGGVLGQDILPK